LASPTVSHDGGGTLSGEGSNGCFNLTLDPADTLPAPLSPATSVVPALDHCRIRKIKQEPADQPVQRRGNSGKKKGKRIARTKTSHKQRESGSSGEFYSTEEHRTPSQDQSGAAKALECRDVDHVQMNQKSPTRKGRYTPVNASKKGSSRADVYFNDEWDDEEDVNSQADGALNSRETKNSDLKEAVAASSSSRAVMSAAKERKRPVSVGQSEKEDETRSGRMKALNNEKRNDDEKTRDVGKISVVRNRKSKTPAKIERSSSSRPSDQPKRKKDKRQVAANDDGEKGEIDLLKKSNKVKPNENKGEVKTAASSSQSKKNDVKTKKNMPVLQNDESNKKERLIDQLAKAAMTLTSDYEGSGSESGCFPIQSKVEVAASLSSRGEDDRVKENMKQQPAVPNEEEGGKEDGTTDRLMTASDAVSPEDDEEGKLNNSTSSPQNDQPKGKREKLCTITSNEEETKGRKVPDCRLDDETSEGDSDARKKTQNRSTSKSPADLVTPKNPPLSRTEQSKTKKASALNVEDGKAVANTTTKGLKGTYRRSVGVGKKNVEKQRESRKSSQRVSTMSSSGYENGRATEDESTTINASETSADTSGQSTPFDNEKPEVEEGSRDVVVTPSKRKNKTTDDSANPKRQKVVVVSKRGSKKEHEHCVGTSSPTFDEGPRENSRVERPRHKRRSKRKPADETLSDDSAKPGPSVSSTPPPRKKGEKKRKVTEDVTGIKMKELSISIPYKEQVIAKERMAATLNDFPSEEERLQLEERIPFNKTIYRYGNHLLVADDGKATKARMFRHKGTLYQFIIGITAKP